MILADLSEPAEMVKLISQSIPCEYSNLNKIHFSDYLFGCSIGTMQFSRKQTAELLSNLDSAEQQLRDYYYNANRNYQIVEGLITPIPIANIPIDEHGNSNEVSIRNLSSGGLYTYRVEVNGYVHSGHHFPKTTGAMYYAWIHRLAEAGIPTYFTATWAETARLLVAIYRNEQKPPDEHSTLNRIIVPRLMLKEQNNFVRSMVYLSHVYSMGIGEDKATRIAKNYSSFQELLQSDIKDIIKIKGIGKTLATRLLAALGKEM